MSASCFSKGRFVVAGLLLLAGCTVPITYSAGPYTELDKDTDYHVDERPDGFVLTIKYERYQFIPDQAAVLLQCKQALINLAHDLAERRGRSIEPIDEQRVRLSAGRNIGSGMTLCAAQTGVRYRP